MMNTYDCKHEISRLINGRTPTRMPIFPVALDQYACKMEGVPYRTYSTDAKAIEHVWRSAAARFELDCIALFIDDLLEFEPLGIQSTDEPDRPRAVARTLDMDEFTVRNLTVPNPKTTGRMPVNLEAVRLLKKRYRDGMIVASSVAAPFTALTLAFGMAPVMIKTLDDPDFLKKSLTFFETLAITWSCALIEAGVDLIWLGDCSASSRFISAKTARCLAIPSAKAVTDAIRSKQAGIIYHAAENRDEHLRAMCEIGADVLTVAEGADMTTAKNIVGPNRCIMGNIDSISVLTEGTPVAIKEHVTTLSRGIAKKGGVWINLAEGIPLQVPLLNLSAYFDAIRNVRYD